MRNLCDDRRCCDGETEIVSVNNGLVVDREIDGGVLTIDEDHVDIVVRSRLETRYSPVHCFHCRLSDIETIDFVMVDHATAIERVIESV